MSDKIDLSHLSTPLLVGVMVAPVGGLGKSAYIAFTREDRATGEHHTVTVYEHELTSMEEHLIFQMAKPLFAALQRMNERLA